MRRELDPPLPDAQLSDSVLEARDATDARYLTVPLNTSTLDLFTDTRWAAIWQLSGRSVAPGQSLLTQVGARFRRGTFPTARPIHEANRLIQVFCDREEYALLEQWFADRPPKPATVRKAIRRVADRGCSSILDGRATAEAETRLYDALSSTVHPLRPPTELAVSSRRRTLVTGPNPDWGVRAYYVAWAGATSGKSRTVSSRR